MATKHQRYEQRQRDKGLVQVSVWVPVEKAQQLKEYAKRLRGKP